jgi:cobalt-zinc-cadmium efflux system protein
MQAVPPGMDLQKILDELGKIEGISNIHHVHVWGLSEKEFHFECHADLEKDLSVSHTADVRNEMSNILQEKFQIGHLTVQFEFNECDDKNIIHSK